ncbi:MAG TPA: phospholipid carrier-dependent glycosyltransferase [Deltaproteobacteria bacterium]|jgi:hypothetical protein|nr:phospholipid carrier-dependent glycosyltransferase [Deltaproteobacteria bacterium]
MYIQLDTDGLSSPLNRSFRGWIGPLRKPDYAAVLLPLALSSIWFIMALSVNPVGNFPLNDDWVYAYDVKSLVEHGKFQFVGWEGMSLIVHILWGSLFCLPFGFSFTALRLSNLTMGLVGILAVYAFLREAKASRGASFFGAFILASNPLYFELSNTFMTDISFFAISTLSFCFFIRGIRNENPNYIVAGTVLCCMATLTRELGLAIPLSFSIAYLIKNGFQKRPIFIAVLPPVLAGFALIAYQTLLKHTIGIPAHYYDHSMDLIQRISTGIPATVVFFGQNFGATLAYLGLFILPLSILFIRGQWKSALSRNRLYALVASLSIIIAVMSVLTWKNCFMPFLRNIWFVMGLGPVTLRDVYILKLPHLYAGPKVLPSCITFLGLAGAAILAINLLNSLSSLISRPRGSGSVKENWLTGLLLVACVVYFIPIGIIGLYDRYLLFLLPEVMAITVLAAHRPELPPGRFPVFVSAVLVLVYFTFALGATHDYLSFNRARWDALHYLTEDVGISHERIDGGFEFNGWYGYDPEYRPVRGADGVDKSWWWVKDDEFMISLGPVDGYEEVGHYLYQRWIPCRVDDVFILHRITGPK